MVSSFTAVYTLYSFGELIIHNIYIYTCMYIHPLYMSVGGGCVLCVSVYLSQDLHQPRGTRWVMIIFLTTVKVNPDR